MATSIMMQGERSGPNVKNDDQRRCRVWEKRRPSAAHDHRVAHRLVRPQQKITHNGVVFFREFLVVFDPNDPSTLTGVRQVDKKVLDRFGHEPNSPIASNLRRSDKNEVRQTIDRIGDEAASGEGPSRGQAGLAVIEALSGTELAKKLLKLLFRHEAT